MRPGLGFLVLTAVLSIWSLALPAADGFYVPGGGAGGNQNWTTGGTNGDDHDWDDTSGAGAGAAVQAPGTNAGETATFDTTGTVNVSGAPANPPHISVTSGTATINMSVSWGAGNVTLAAGTTLALTGTGTLQVTSLTMGAGSTISVAAGVTLTIGSAVTFGASTFNNAGIVRFDNNADFTGATVSNTNILRFDSTNQSNAVTTGGVNLGATVDCVGGANTTTFMDALLCANLTLGSAGTVTFSAGVNITGNLTQTSGTVNLDAGSNFGDAAADTATISAGTLDGTGVSVDFRDITVNGSGSLTTGSGSIGGTTAFFSTSGNITLGNTTFNSGATTTLTPDAIDDFTANITVGSGTTLVLAGSLTMTGGGVTVNNNNNLTINNGVLLRCDGDFSFAGAGNLVVGTANPALDLRGATNTFSTATVTNNGTIVFDSTINATVNVINCNRLSGNIDTNGGGNTVAFDANAMNLATLDCNGAGNATFAAAVGLTGGYTRTGGGNSTHTGALTVGTTLIKSGTGALSLAGGGSVTGDFTLSNGDVTSGGTLTLTGANIDFTGAGNVTLGNVTFNRSGVATLTLDAADDLAGNVSVSAGTTLDVASAITFFNGSALSVAATGILELNGTTATFTGVTVTNSGLIRFDTTSANITVTGSGQLGGVLGFIGAANTTIFGGNPASGSTLNITAGNTLRFTAATVLTGITVNNNGIIQFSGTFNVTPLGATTLGHVIVSTGTVTFITAGLTVTDFDLQGTASATVNLTFNSTGVATTSTSTGTLTLTGVATITGSLQNTGNGAVAMTAGGTVGGVLLQNSSTMTAAAAVTVNGDVTVQDSTNLNANAVALDISGNLTVSNTAQFRAGNGTQLGGATVSLSSSGTIQIANVTFDRAGTTTLTYAAANLFTGSITVSNGTTVNGAGNLTVAGVLTVGGGAAATLAITGNLTLSAATGSVAASGILTVSGLMTLTGTAFTVSGTLNLGGDLTETGNGTLAGAGTTNLSGATFAINTDATGTLALTALTVAGGTTVNQNGNVLLIGSVQLNTSASWAGGANTLGLATVASSVTITVGTGSFVAGAFTAGNAAGADVTVSVTGSGSFTVDSITVPLANAGGQNILTLNETSTGTLQILGDVTVLSDDAGTQGDGGELDITASSTVTIQGDLIIGTSGLGGPALAVDACTISIGANSTLSLSGVTTPTFAVGRNSILEVTGTTGNQAVINVTGGTPYAMTLDGGVRVSFLDLSGYDASGLQMLAEFGAASVAALDFSFSNVRFLGGVVGGTHLSVTPNLVLARGGVGAGQAQFLEMHFGNGITATGTVVTAVTIDTSAVKIANLIDDFGIGFTMTAVEAESTGAAGQIGGDNDGAAIDVNITWGNVTQNNTLTVTNHVNNPFGTVLGLGNSQIIMIASFTASGSDPSITVSSITLTLSGTDVAADIQNLTITFDTDGDGVGDSTFASAQNPAGAGPITFTGDTQVINNGVSMRMIVLADIVAGADTDTIQVEIVDALTDVVTDVNSASTGSADSGVRAIATVVGAVFTGGGNPANQNANPDDIKAALHFKVSVDVNSPSGLTITSVLINIQTNDNTTNLAIDHIASATLWQGNGDNSLGGGDVLLETVDNGAVGNGWSEAGSLVSITFGPTSIVIAPGGVQDFWVSIAFTSVGIAGVPQPTFTAYIDNAAGDALNGGGTTGFQGIVYGGSIVLGTWTPGDPLEKKDTYHDEDNSCELAARNEGNLPLALLLLMMGAVAMGAFKRLRGKKLV